MPEDRKHLVFIINPHSGTDRIKAIQSAIDAGIDGARYTHTTAYTERPQHGTELARQAAAAGAFAVVAVGGDGSVSDVATGLAGSATALGIIPKGSGNGMARTIGLPLDVVEAIRVVNGGRLQRIDAGSVNGRMFLSNAGVGFDALISKKFSGSTRRGLVTYAWLVTKYLWMYRSWDWRITIDGKPLSERAFLINVANGQQFGYNFKIAPDASYTDGYLDLTIIRKFPPLLGGGIALRALFGDITKSPYVVHYRAKEVSIVHPDLKLMQTDGDAHPCGNRLDFHVLPSALDIIIP